jgi:hypothetical protein
MPSNSASPAGFSWHMIALTVAAGILQHAEIIRNNRGQITVLNRSALEATACDCYAAVKRRFNTLLGSHPETEAWGWSS